jgi:hypothetical protein
MHWYDANTDDWSAMTKEITDYYSNTTKSFLQIIKERKKKLAKLKSFGCGFSILIVLIVSFGLFLDFMTKFVSNTVYNPAYEENCYIYDKETFTTITKYTADKEYTNVYFRSVNLTDDTLRRVEYDTVGAMLETLSQFIISTDYHPLISISGTNNTKLPQYYPGGKGSYVDYVMTFSTVRRKEFNFVSKGNHCIFGIQNKENHEAMTLEDNILEHIDSELSTLTVEHPEYFRGINNLFVTRIEIDDSTTSLHFHIVNPTDHDTTLFDPKDCRIVVYGDTLTMKYVNGIKPFPYKHTLFKKSAMDFAIHYPPIYLFTESIDVVINDSTKISNLNLKRKNITTADPPIVTGQSLGSAYLTKVDINQDETVLHFKQTNRFKQTPIYATANRKAYITADGVKYRLVKVSGIEFAPTRTLIPAGTTLEYALIFAPLPPDTKMFDYVNIEFSRDKLGEQRFKAFKYILGSECVNEKEDMIATGIFGIKMK